MSEAMEQANREGPVMGIIAYADDFIVSCEGGNRSVQVVLHDEGDRWDGDTKRWPSRRKLWFWALRQLSGLDGSWWKQDASPAQKRLSEASEFAGHVEAVAQLHLDARKSEALWLMTSKSMARSPDFDAKVVNSKKMKPMAETLDAKTKCICEKLLERSHRR